MLYPSDIFDKLEFTKVLKLLMAYCFGDEGRRYFENIEIHYDKKTIVNLLEETDEWKKCIERSENIPIGSYDTVHDDLYMLRKADYVLDVEAIQRIHRIIFLTHQLNIFFQDYLRQKSMPRISNLVLNIRLDTRMLSEIERVFDEEGNVKPNASEALSKISKSIHNKEREAEKVFRQELAFYKEKGYLVENLESIKNNRLVLIVGAESKRRIAGVIHDESASGKTVFIEPDKCIAINNEIYNLYADRRAEIYRIIRELCRFLNPFADEIEGASQLIVKLDTIRAKAKLAVDLLAGKPKVIGKPIVNFKEAFNPLLFLRLNESGGTTVPFDLELLAGNRFLILSGPNAGGKSVTLKTVGLLQLMFQAGMHITADENSEMGIYKKIFVDIGDQQSLDDDLSTYSSHLQNMKKVLDEADENTLVLIDEFGSGTDPKIGGAIAESILRFLNQKKCFGFVTTHYGNLKYYAYKTKGLVNASMEFDKQNLTPTFHLRVGKPGSSFAFEIASKTGLPQEVTDYARSKTGEKENAIEDMLIDLQTERKEYFDKMSEVLEKEEKLDKLIQTYELLHGEIEFRKKKLKIDQKEVLLAQSSDRVHELQKIVKELRNTANAAKAEKLLVNEKEKLVEANQELSSLKEVAYKEIKFRHKDFEVGDYVKVRNGDSTGKILSVDKESAELEMGFMKLRIPLKDLLPAEAPVAQKSKSVNTSGVSGYGSYEKKLDLRGYRVEEAMDFLQEFIEKALINDAFEVHIIHGVGNGTLKKGVHKKLKEYKDIKEYWHPDENLGGEGVTYVKF